ncbi:hypothetical protein E1264_00200 [Actinomadura sp. KC216]|uniref:hypothetical protein n=1 Tax=Actinomadura sp. KC216 TaxID=2530370 RepID=UPI0010434C80|nr:hypothetical protein [Actinomadura sp. KC216]TDB91927.1 hypothetical protein E1264_00200 [Actinomadura sp. KC216]
MIPHYDNAEGGTHDTRYCYLGERRLRVLEEELPDDAAVLGLDEHTAAVVDVGRNVVRVCGRGVMTVRRRGERVVVPSGETLSLTGPRALVRGEAARRADRPRDENAEAVRVTGDGALAVRVLAGELGGGRHPDAVARELLGLSGDTAAHCCTRRAGGTNRPGACCSPTHAAPTRDPISRPPRWPGGP